MWRENATGAAGSEDGRSGRSAVARSASRGSESALASRVPSSSERSPAVSEYLAISRYISEYLGISRLFGQKKSAEFRDIRLLE